VRESCDTGCEGTSYIGVDQSHLCCFIVVFVMHVMDHVQSSNVQMSQPVHHNVVFLHNLIIVQILAGDRLIFRSNLLFCLLIFTAVDSVQKAFCKVCTSAEELDLLTGLGSRYTAADGVIIAPYRTHYIIVLILDGACLYRNMSCIFLESFRKILRVQNSKVRLWGRSHVFQCVQETEIVLCNDRTSINTHTSNFQSSPYRVTGEQLIVGRDSCEFNHTEFHYQMVYQLLSLFLGQDSFFDISFDVDIKESRYTANAHCSTVLSFDSCKVSEVQPLNSFSCVLSRLGNVIAIGLCHNFHILQCSDLVSDLFS